MNASRKVTARLRTENTARLHQLLRLYPREAQVMAAEITRRTPLSSPSCSINSSSPNGRRASRPKP